MAINIDELQIQIGIEASKSASGLKRLASSLRNVKSDAQGASSALKGAAQGVKDLGTSTSEASEAMKDADKKSVSALARIAEAAKSAAPKLKAVASGVKGVGVSVATHLGKALASPFVSFGKSVSNAVSRITTLFSAIKRIAMYRLIRSAIKLMTQAISEGVKTLIEWDRTWGNNTSGAAQAADEITAKWGEVKKAFGAAAMPLIQILQPALMAVMNTVIAVVNTINQFFRMFQGFGTYMKATAGAISTSVGAASKAAKELQRVLFGFDELNVLPSPTSSGSGGGSASSGGVDYVETPISDRFKIDTSGKTLGAQLAELINNAVKNANVSNLGKRVAEKINHALANVKDFITGVNFVGVGEKIGEFVSSAIKNIKWGDLGRIVGAWIVALPKMLIGMINTLDFYAVGSAIHDFVISAVDEVSKFLKDTDWKTTGNKLMSGLVDFIKGLKPLEIAKAIVKLIGSALKAAAELLSGAIDGLIESVFGVPGIDIVGSINRLFGFETEPSIPIKLAPELDQGASKNALKDVDIFGRTVNVALSPLGIKTDPQALSNAKRDIDIFFGKIGGIVKQFRENSWFELSGLNNDWRADLFRIKGETEARWASIKQTAAGAWQSLKAWFTGNPIEPVLKANLDSSQVMPKLNETIQRSKQLLSLNTLIAMLKLKDDASGETSDTLTKLKSLISQTPLSLVLKIGRSGIVDSLSTLLYQLQTALNRNPLNVGVQTSSNPTTASYNTTKFKNAVAVYAGGGVPDIGTLFYAGEAGAEIVATGRSGQTGVMNMQQMQEAVASGNMEVVNALYAVANMLGNEIRSKDNNVYLDGDKIGQSVSRYQYNQARRGIQGVY